MENIYTTKELCQKLSISKGTLARWRSQGLPYIKISSGTVRYELAAVMVWIEARNAEQTGAGKE